MVFTIADQPVKIKGGQGKICKKIRCGEPGANHPDRDELR